MHWTNFLAVVIISIFLSSMEGAAQCDGGKLEAEDIDQLLKQVDDFRSLLVEEGVVTDVDGKLLPRGKTLSKINWNCTLEKFALATYYGDCDTCKKPSTSNSGTSHGGKSKDIDDTFKYWRRRFSKFLEKKYGIKHLKKYPFANLADAKTTEIGCAYYGACDGNKAYTFFCFTNQAALKESETKEDDVGCKNDSTTYPVGPNEKCPVNVTMTDELRGIYLSMHRDLLIKGQIPRNAQNRHSNATNTEEMELSCELESGAIAYASTCPKAVSPESQRKDIGELYDRVPISSALTYKNAIRKAVTKWWKHVSQPIGDTQTNLPIWANISKLGCSVVKCQLHYVVVCRYSPIANIAKQDDSRGDPCTQCAKGNCTDRGLCSAKKTVVINITL